jgi:hypothetical protein
MDASTLVAISALVIALTVPWMTFRLALQQDHRRWMREQRTALYVDLLVEAHAEADHLEFRLEDDETQARFRKHHVDLRLSSLERARLGARANLLGSRAVGAIFGRMESESLWALLRSGRELEARRIDARYRLGQLLDQLQAQVRKELGADQVDRRTTVDFRDPHPSQRYVPTEERRGPGRQPTGQDQSDDDGAPRP